jgi:hypothetical protein
VCLNEIPDCRAGCWLSATPADRGRCARCEGYSVRKARLADGSGRERDRGIVSVGGEGQETAGVAKGREQDRRRSESFPHSFNEQNERGRQAGPFASPIKAYWARYFPIGGNTQLVRLDSEA